MEKYKLLKDLPNAKAGEIFVIAVDIGALVREHNQYDVLYSKEQLQENDILNLDKGWFEKIEEKKYGGRVPEIGDYYWFIEGYGNIANAYWNGTDVDKTRFECGNAFWTFEEAEKELKRRKAYVVLKEDMKGFKPNWEDPRTDKYHVFYTHDKKYLGVDYNYCYQTDLIYFATRADAEASVETHRQQWLDYLGVEEKE